MTARRVALAVAGLVVGLNVAAGLVDAATGGGPSGPPSSSYSTTTDGVAAYADLLLDRGHRVRRLRLPPTSARLGDVDTVVLLDPAFVAEADAAALRRFVDGGGRLVAGGAGTGWLFRVVDGPPQWSHRPVGGGRTLVPLGPFSAVGAVDAGAPGSWTRAGGSLPVVGRADRSLLVAARVGRGTAYLLASTEPLRNGRIDALDHAALGLALAGEPPARIAFLETYHGYGGATGLGAVPDAWLITLAGVTAAALAFIVSRGRRLGPPEAHERELAPPRRLYVEALGTLLARSRDSEGAAEPLRARARRIAARVGATEEEERALAAPAATPAELLALGRAAASLERRVRGGGRT